MHTFHLPVPQGIILEVSKQRDGVFELSHPFLQHMADSQSLHFLGELAQSLHKLLNAIRQLLDVQVGPQSTRPLFTGNLQ